MKTPISILRVSTISALGGSSEQVWSSYLEGKPLFTKRKIDGEQVYVSELSSEINAQVTALVNSKQAYKNLDRSVLLGILAARFSFSGPGLTPVKVSNFDRGKARAGINIGSSRGATELFETYFQQFQEKGKVSPFSSPTTTLGNISSWIAQDLGLNGVQIGHSVTCSTAMHSVLNGIAWLQSDMANAFLVGGSEAALTPFTIAQMKALKLYASSESTFPCESLKFQKKKNSMILGEGAGVAVLEKGISERTQAIIKGYGFASEILEHNSSISQNANCFQDSMKMALEKAGLKTVDAIVMHAPGTVKGDQAEKNAIDLVFDEAPLLTSNKWMLGHTLGASGMMSIEMAVLMLQKNHFIENPMYTNEAATSRELKTILVNAVGFGGNAVSIILEKPV